MERITSDFVEGGEKASLDEPNLEEAFGGWVPHGAKGPSNDAKTQRDREKRVREFRVDMLQRLVQVKNQTAHCPNSLEPSLMGLTCGQVCNAFADQQNLHLPGPGSL